MCDPQTSLNGNLVVDLPFQTLTIETSSTTACSRNAFLQVNQGIPYLIHNLLYLSEG